MEHHDILKVLRRLLDEKQALANQLHDQHDYSAEFPASEAEALQYALDHLSLEGPLTFTARYYKTKYEALAEPDANAVLRGLVVTNPKTSVYTPEEFDLMRRALKAAWGGRCTYPDCSCPFDTPNTCAKGLPVT